MSDIILGKNLIVQDTEGAIIAAATTCQIIVDTEMIETCSESGGYKEYYTGRTGWSVSVGYFVTNTTIYGKGELVSLTLNGSPLGTARVQRWAITGTVGHLSQGQLSFLGTGPIGEGILESNL